MLKSDSLVQRIPYTIWRYGIALLNVAVALGITHSIERYTTLRTPLFFMAIILSAWFGGKGPGLLAVVLSTVLVDYYFAPGDETPVISTDSRPFILLFSVSSLLAWWVSLQRRKAEDALMVARDKLEERVEERTADLLRVSEELRAEIAERKRGEEALKERANLLDLTHDTVIVRDINNIITFWNRGAEEQYGLKREEAVGQESHRLLQTTFPKPLEEIVAELESTGRWEGELIHTRRDGTRVVVASRWALQLDDKGMPVGVLETNNDITERKRAEESLNKAQMELAHVSRLSTLGELTASIAHEVNQPLAAVVTNANASLRWLARTPPELEEARLAISRIVKEGNRAGDVITRIRALVKKSPPQKIILDSNDIVLEVITLSRSQISRAHISLRTHLAEGLPSVLADRVQLQQVILNLIINAIDAMKDVPEGHRQLLVSSQPDQSGGVLIAVEDSGHGLSQVNLDHLFEAFYTTKPDGMGMGLAISRSIIEAHGGKLLAITDLSQGARFELRLPASNSEITV